MARSTPIIAAAGVGLLAAAVVTAAIRGADDGTPSDVVTTPADATETFATDAVTTEDLPTETETATDDETDGNGDGDPTDGPTDDATDDGDPTDGPTDDATDDAADATDDATDDEGDDGDPTAVGPTSEMPETGGGALTALGGVVAAGAAVAGRRRTR